MDSVDPKPPEEIFPLEVWDLILDNLRSPIDLITCKQVCKAWAKLLESKKTTILMPKVFPILYKYLEHMEAIVERRKRRWWRVREENATEKEIERTITTILKMRLVSHGWKESVDDYHQNHPLLNDIGFIEQKEEDINIDGELFPLLPYHFGSSLGHEDALSLSKLASFLEKGFPPESNPFITRYVKYNDLCYDERHQRRLNIAFKNLLKAFGSQIWTCNLSFNLDSCENAVNFYKHVASYLTLMPNLRSLVICRYFYMTPKENPRKKELELLLQNEPLPRLEHLTKLEMSDIPYPLSAGLLASNRHLQKLSLQKYNDDDDANLPDCIVNVQLPSLQQLAFPCCEVELLQLPQVRWPIKALHLTIREEESILKNIFLAVSSTFSDTLEHFVIDHWNAIENNKELKQSRLELPKLKIFQMKLPYFELETIDFLQGCIALQKLQMEFQVPDKDGWDDDSDDSSSSSNSFMNEDEEDIEVIQFKDCITSMTQSNIWRILNKLQSIKITMNGVHLYPEITHRIKRQQFEKMRKQMGQETEYQNRSLLSHIMK